MSVVYPLFASGTDFSTGASETISGTVTVSGTFITGVDVASNAYPGVAFDVYYGGGGSVISASSAMQVPTGGFDSMTIVFGTHSTLPHAGADIFGWWISCCDARVFVLPNNWITAPSLGTIAGLPLPVSEGPMPVLGTGWTSLLIVALMWGCYRHRRAMR